MKSFVFIFCFLSIRASAFLGGGDTNISQNFPCVGLDGVPITAGAMEQQCCRSGRLVPNAPATCRAGFNSILGDSAGGAAFNLSLAQTTLSIASGMNGTTTDLNAVSANHSGGALGGSGGQATEVAAIQSGSGTGDGSGMGSSTFDSAGMGEGVGSAGSTAGGNTSGGSMSVGQVGGANFGNSKDKDSNQGSDAKNPPGGFLSASGNAGKSGLGSSDFNFGGNDGARDPASAGDADELGFNEDDGTLADGNGEVEGTANDPSNYFNLTNKSDDLFKIVSRRYIRKYKKFAKAGHRERVPASKTVNNKPL